MESKIQELRELRRMAEELEAEIAAIQDSIKAEMTATGVYEMSGTDYKVTWKEVATSRIDTAALKNAVPDLVAAFTKTATVRRFVLA